MARIVYGVSGEGSGHSSRAREVMTHLLERGHEVRAVSYDRGFRNLRDDFDVHEVEGLSIATAENRVSLVRTLTDNLARVGPGARRVRELRRRCFREFDPQVVISDFEPTTAYLALHCGLPLVSLDNQHRMRYMRFPEPAHLRADALVTRSVIRLLVPRPDVSLVTTFRFGEVLNERTFLFPPILRREVLALEPEQRDDAHVLCYFTHGPEPFLEDLRAERGARFVVYGGERSDRPDLEGEQGNVSFRRPSRAGFLEDLRTCRAVVATAGFTLMTEALQLRKPMLALPMAGQFEQELNALLLEELGCGRNGRERGTAALGAFLEDLPRHREALARQPRRDGNRELTDRLDALLAGDCAEARAFHARRRE
jgi:uncharacterized protein (TIGR00661 family)